MKKYKNIALNNQYIFEQNRIICPLCKTDFKIQIIGYFKKMKCSTTHSLNWQIYFNATNLYYRIEFRKNDRQCEYIYYYYNNSCNIYLGDELNYSGINIENTSIMPDIVNFNINNLFSQMETYHFFS